MTNFIIPPICILLVLHKISQESDNFYVLYTYTSVFSSIEHFYMQIKISLDTMSIYKPHGKGKYFRNYKCIHFHITTVFNSNTLSNPEYYVKGGSFVLNALSLNNVKSVCIPHWP